MSTKPKSNRIENVLEQLSGLWQQYSNRVDEKVVESIKDGCVKLLTLLTSSEIAHKDLIVKYNLPLLVQLIQGFMIKEQQITLILLECLLLVLTTTKQAARGLLQLLFQVLTNTVPDLASLKYLHSSPDILRLLHQVIYKLATREKSFATIARVCGGVEASLAILKTFENNSQLHLQVIRVIQLYADSSVNCGILAKKGLIMTVQNHVTTVGKKKQILRHYLELLSTLCKHEKAVHKLVGVGLVGQLLNCLHEWQSKEKKRTTNLQKSVVNILKMLTGYKCGRNALQGSFTSLLSLTMDEIHSQEACSCVKNLLVVLRKLRAKKLPLVRLKSVYNFQLHQDDSDEESRDSDSSSSSDCSLVVDSIEGSTDNLLQEANQQQEEEEDKEEETDDSYAVFMPEITQSQLSIYIPTPTSPLKNVEPEVCHVKSDSCITSAKAPFKRSVSDTALMNYNKTEQQNGSSYNTETLEHVLTFAETAIPDLLSHQSRATNNTEPLLPKNALIARYKLFSDLQRLLPNSNVFNRTVYDLDLLEKGKPKAKDHGRTKKHLTVKPSKSAGKAPSTKSIYKLLTLTNCHAPEDCTSTEQLEFESRFESGNLRKAVQIRCHEYDLLLNPDINSTNHHQWFYFKVTNMQSKIAYRFNIVNCEKVNSQFNFGMQPVLFSTRCAVEQKQGWRRSGTSVCYYKNCYVKSNGKSYFSASFNITFPYASDTCYLAYHYPYTFSLLNTHFLELEKRLPSDVAYTKQTLCRTLSGNDVPLITITDRRPSHTAEEKKKYVFLSARVHPGESNSSWVMKGLLDFLLSSEKEATRLRSLFVFKIVPILNPDGVINGSHRCSLVGQDLNRHWKNPDKYLHPTIYHTKKMLVYLSTLNKAPVLFVDFHGHSRKKNVFLYGCKETREIPQLCEAMEGTSLEDQSVVEPATEECGKQLKLSKLDAQVELLPSHLNEAASCFSIDNCHYAIEKSKESTARVVAYRELGIVRSYTMESTYCGMDQGPYSGVQINTSMLRETGVNFAKVLLKISSQLS